MSRFFYLMLMLTCFSVKFVATNVKDKYNMSRFVAIADVNVGH